MKSAPPIGPLATLVRRLEEAGIGVALGGSGLLAALGLADTARDWDLTTDAPLERVLGALAGERFTHTGPDALHADQKLGFAGGTVELIVGMAFRVPGGVVRIPTRVAGRRDDIPLGSAEAWAVAYHLLGREAKSELLLAHLAARGADRAMVAALLREPLPPMIRGRLAALMTSSDT